MSENKDDDEIDDASLSSMRSVWLSMRDEEPPAAGMSALMAAAAAKATELRDARPSWWQRALAQLRRPPALAFATVMILVGGAVLVTRNEDTMKVEEKVAAPAPETELRVQDEPVVPDPPMAAPVTGGVDSAAPPRDSRGPKDVKQRAKPRPKAAGGKATLDGDVVGPNEPSPENRFEASSESPSYGRDVKKVEPAPGMVDERGGTTQTAPVVRDDAGETVTGAAPTKPTSPNEQLARQAESAASRGDCPAVRTIVARLRKQDEAFYQARLGKTAAVTKCL